MENQNLIIFNFTAIFKILSEIENNLNFKIIKIDKEDLNNFDEKKYPNFLLLTKNQIPKIENQFILDNLPIKLSKLIERINIEFLKVNYKDQSNYTVGNYNLDLNSKSFSKEGKNLKLTEKEISTILYLSKNKKSISIKELQTKVWDHKSLLETHTVETHIHRLRKKIKQKFNDESFIISSKEGYSIN